MIEWADRLGGMLSDWTLRISIDFVSPSVHRGCFERAELRNVKIRVKDERYGQWDRAVHSKRKSRWWKNWQIEYWQ